MIESTLTLIKPDAFERKLIGVIMTDIEETDLEIYDIDVGYLTPTDVAKLYCDHRLADYYGRLSDHMISGKVMMLTMLGDDAVKVMRRVVHEIRAKWVSEPGPANLIHSSDSWEAAKRELPIFFN